MKNWINILIMLVAFALPYTHFAEREHGRERERDNYSWCCECRRGSLKDNENLGWMGEQRCYGHGGWCNGLRRKCVQ